MNMLRTILSVISVIFLTFLCLNQAPYPYIWIFVLWLGGLSICIKRSARANSKAVFVNVLVVVALLLGLEIFVTLKNPPALTDRNYSQGYRTDHPDLGYAPQPNQVAESDMSANGQLTYDVQYTIDEFALRRGPDIDSSDCILFFGGSFVFGEGVADDQALPWLTGVALATRTINFGFHGYGPHQMLANIDTGKVASTVDCAPVAAVYVLIDDHMFRSAGKASWDVDGPRYVVNDAGRAIRQGKFSDYKSSRDAFGEKVQGKLVKSNAYQYFFGNRRTFEESDLELLESIFVTAREALEASYPQLRFMVLHWNNPQTKHTALIQAALRAANIELYQLTDGINDLQNASENYALRGDGHPNPIAHKRAADFMAQILQTTSPAKLPAN